MTHIAYHVTTDLSSAQHIAAATAASRQDAWILAIFRSVPRPMTALEAHQWSQDADHHWPEGSTRRAVTNLYKAGLLVKLGTVEGRYPGAPHHLYALPAGQGELFVGRVA